MVLGGLALAFSRLIDNSVVVLENIFRHMEMGEAPEVAAEKGGQEVALPVLAATLTTDCGFLSRRISLWREPIPVYRVGCGGCALDAGLVLRRHDRCAVVLRQADQVASPGARTRSNLVRVSAGLSPGSTAILKNWSGITTTPSAALCCGLPPQRSVWWALLC